MTSMFHTGDLQSGISSAIQQQKLVACFIRADDDTTSATWEGEWLSDLHEVIEEKAVLLRLNHGSQEAGFLGAFCTIDKAPTLVVIHNGRVLDKLDGDLGREEWTERLLRALGLGEDDVENEEKEVNIGDNPATSDVAQAASAVASAVLPRSLQPSDSADSSPSVPQSETPASLFPDRAAKLEAEKVKRDAAEKAARQARSDARRKEAEDAYQHHRGDKGKGKATEDTEKQKTRDAWIYQQKQRKDEAKKERERILNQIEADKQERRARMQRAKDAEARAAEGASSAMPESRLAGARRSAGAGGNCSLLIRLFDGSSLRTRFPTSATLAKEVRDWIRTEAPAGSGGADVPFTFRQILAPNPSRSIEVSEEHQTLEDLDLVPNATLVLVPVAGSVDAYASSDTWLGWGAGLMSGTYNRASYFLPSFSRLYLGGTGDAQEPSNAEGAAMAGADSSAAGGGDGAIDALPGAAKIRVKTLADQRAETAKRQKTEFYNGNSSAFEGRKDDDDDAKTS